MGRSRGEEGKNRLDDGRSLRMILNRIDGNWLVRQFTGVT